METIVTTETITGAQVMMYVLALGFFGLFAVVIIKMLRNTITLNDLLGEANATGKASLSRFQLLVFTLVVAGVFLILSIENAQIMEIPNSVLGLLGISGGSYLVSKGITKKDGETEPLDTEAKAKAAEARALQHAKAAEEARLEALRLRQL